MPRGFAVRAYLAQDDDIDTVLIELRGLLDITVDHQFATVLLGELDPARGTVRLVSAGHFPPLLLSGGRAELLDCPVGPPVGVATSAAPAGVDLQVAGAATLLAFTDGAVERRGEDIGTGLERLRSTAAAARGQQLATVLDRLMDATAAQGGRDDTVILGLRWPLPGRRPAAGPTPECGSAHGRLRFAAWPACRSWTPTTPIQTRSPARSSRR